MGEKHEASEWLFLMLDQSLLSYDHLIQDDEPNDETGGETFPVVNAQDLLDEHKIERLRDELRQRMDAWRATE
jgi:hypothetical protein